MTVIEGWQPRTLVELADYINGFAFKPDDWGKDGLPIIRIEQLKNPDAATDYYAGRLPAAQIIDNGDLIFSWSASLFLRIWRHGRGALNQHLFKVVEREWVDRSFLKAFIEFYLPELTRASHGSTMQHITRKELDRFSAQFPVSKYEQSKIAEILTTMDQAIEQAAALIAKRKRIRAGLMQDLLTCGIDEHGNLRSEQTHEFKDSPLGRIPMEWEVLTLAQCSRRVVVGLASSTTHAYRDVGIPMIRNQNIRKGHFDDREMLYLDPDFAASFPTKAVQVGDVLTVRTGANVGDTAMVPSKYAGCQTFTTLITSTKQHVLVPEYLVWYVESHLGQAELNRILVGGGKENLNAGQFVNLRIAVPPPRQQNVTVECLETIRSSLAEEQIILGKYRRLKTGLMQDLLTGRRRVTALLVETEMATA